MTEPRISVTLVEALIADQFPHWAHLPVQPVNPQGWDNRTFRLGEEMAARLPSAARYAAQAAKEQRWLPHLAAHLPLQVPEPLAAGKPSESYPFQWSIMRWLPGETVAQTEAALQQSIAADLADFLNALRRVPTTDAPGAGLHNFYRSGDLRIYDQEARHCLAQLGEAVDGAGILRLWDRACQSAWTAAPVWVHGDVAPGNLLLRNGRLGAVIDFGCCGIGDPACDLTIAWTLFDTPARKIFRDGIGLDAQTWARAMGWAIWKALLQMCQGQTIGQNTLTAVMAET
ncbi:aminoglycoside phosphotransferase family protein [Cognatiyoonia sp. IB215446]|uniref:aminoglycoside phosphotransferase family protein n=1 Tax=Cognatiyoonia sp. IB215446 TaxID=3097355 RepID=UPI002A0BC01F|nr:aminoglycoside phosphotransferase family protein [Cognatiyoonia sp. IB215446]MDX8347665.1 aminoglycoside phosphotransferase family protein [Cognatiyoonia sp. IB215446]